MKNKYTNLIFALLMAYVGSLLPMEKSIDESELYVKANLTKLGSLSMLEKEHIMLIIFYIFDENLGIEAFRRNLLSGKAVNLICKDFYFLSKDLWLKFLQCPFLGFKHQQYQQLALEGELLLQDLIKDISEIDKMLWRIREKINEVAFAADVVSDDEEKIFIDEDYWLKLRLAGLATITLGGEISLGAAAIKNTNPDEFEEVMGNKFILLITGSSWNLKDAYGNTSLMLAIASKNDFVIEHMIATCPFHKRRLLMLSKNHNGNTILDILNELDKEYESYLKTAAFEQPNIIWSRGLGYSPQNYDLSQREVCEYLTQYFQDHPIRIKQIYRIFEKYYPDLFLDPITNS